jgi:hypothetical protein
VIDELIQAEIKTVVPPVKTRRKSESASSLAKKGANIHVLLCGFRVEWVNDVRRFKNRLKVRYAYLVFFVSGDSFLCSPHVYSFRFSSFRTWPCRSPRGRR